ncbi:MAG TPA: heparan-alpha-glucosaminide N-acetyltransferase domain-containing protein [Mucilaginibacter sp.]|jgi:uncharacterized membrane protein|nr:heparan-alpha-glucosaminide N-acetyltransferase domain-containing protein [Mucilaginibacter sp.]
MATTTLPAPKYRIESIDILRGAVMLIMAIDHIRDFFHGSPEPTDLAVTTPILFFTRWITHFCAPAFVFLSGVSAYLAGTRRTENQLGMFLIKRGFWLLFVEVALITLAITLNPFYNVLILQVIWAIGGSMILLGLMVLFKVPVKVIVAIGGIILLGHNIFDTNKVDFINNTVAGKMLFSGAGFGAFVPFGPNRGMLVAYALLPWASVMFIGYGFGQLYRKTFDVARRRKILLYAGLGTLLFFLVFRYFNIYGDPNPWAPQKSISLSIISFFNVTKYPCSLLYLCMTLGTALVVLSVTENVKSKFTNFIIVFGNVPFFYYLCHWYLVKLLNVVFFFAEGYHSNQIVNPKQPLLFQPDGFGVSLLGVYGIWILVIFILYFPCRWFSKYRRTHDQWWLSYL